MSSQLYCSEGIPIIVGSLVGIWLCAFVFGVALFELLRVLVLGWRTFKIYILMVQVWICIRHIDTGDFKGLEYRRICFLNSKRAQHGLPRSKSN